MTKGIGGHHRGHQGKNNEWLTPPAIIESLGPFDLDPCSPVNRPWDTAARHFTIEDDGLAHEWEGRVWLNPPYGPPKVVTPWMERMTAHGNGVALIFARTETQMFFEYVWRGADALLFLEGRLHFHYVDGTVADNNGGAPSVLLAYGEHNVTRLRESGLHGAFVTRVRVLG